MPNCRKKTHKEQTNHRNWCCEREQPTFVAVVVIVAVVAVVAVVVVAVVVVFGMDDTPGQNNSAPDSNHNYPHHSYFVFVLLHRGLLAAPIGPKEEVEKEYYPWDQEQDHLHRLKRRDFGHFHTVEGPKGSNIARPTPTSGIRQQE
jgi:hypothetical protein